MKKNLNYTQTGDYLIPNLTLSETEMKPLGKYGRMRKQYLQENRQVLWNSMVVSQAPTSSGPKELKFRRTRPHGTAHPTGALLSAMLTPVWLICL